MASDRKVLVVGLGKTGFSCARYLAAQGYAVAVTDTRDTPPGLQQLQETLPDTALFLGGFDADAFAVAEMLVVSPGVSIHQPLIQQAQARGVDVIGDVELFARAVTTRVAAITGSNGKSTVTTLLGEMAAIAGLHVRVGGNLGEPVLDLIDPQAELYVLELSSFQLETTRSLQTAAAVVLNISEDHLDRYPSLASYAEAKAGLYAGAAHRIINRDDARVMAMCANVHPEDLYFTLGNAAPGTFGLCDYEGVEWITFDTQRLLPVSELKVSGRHNLANVLAAMAMGESLEIPRSAMLEAVRNFRGLAHRTEYLGVYQGARWYNDSKGTNVGATRAALEGLGQEGAKIVLIAGGIGKGADFSSLRSTLEETARGVVLIGEAAVEMGQAWQGTVPLVQATDLDQAARLAAEMSHSGDVVLLSPACASFDMFDNYMHRGDCFRAAFGSLQQ